MNKTGYKIDYSLRLQKSIERKIFGDIVRTLNYFGPVEDYRYIGLGSFYYKDFLLFFEDFNIQKGISIEIDSSVVVLKDELLRDLMEFYELSTSRIWDNSIEKLIEIINATDSTLSKEQAIVLSNKIAQTETTYFINFCSSLVDEALSSTNLKILENDELLYSFEEIANQLAINTQSLVQSKLQNSLDSIAKNEETAFFPYENVINHYRLIEFTIEDQLNLKECIHNSFLNRYSFNKPYGFIELIFGDIVDVFKNISWDKKQKNIIWLDYDEYLTEKQLLGLEKSIINASAGDLIIFSTSLGSDPQKRKNSLEEIKAENTVRISRDLELKDCDDEPISKTIGEIVKDAAEASLAKKNTIVKDDEPLYMYKSVFECVYSDDTKMYTYGIIIYDENFDDKDENFPACKLKDNVWYPKGSEDKCYSIYIPALTHKEVNAINQYLPDGDVELIKKKLPFLEKQTIRQYINVWRYYPQFFEAGYYV